MSLRGGLLLGAVRGVILGSAAALVAGWIDGAMTALLAFELVGLSALVSATVEAVATERVAERVWPVARAVAALATAVFASVLFVALQRSYVLAGPGGGPAAVAAELVGLRGERALALLAFAAAWTAPFLLALAPRRPVAGDGQADPASAIEPAALLTGLAIASAGALLGVLSVGRDVAGPTYALLLAPGAIFVAALGGGLLALGYAIADPIAGRLFRDDAP